MKAVNVRSPFVIQINEPTQLGSKIELFIWYTGQGEPTTPTYTLSKPIPTTAQRLTSYNVSNFVKEYIQNINSNYTGWVAFDSFNNYVLFRVKRYWDNAGVYTLLDNQTYVGVDGFTNYMDGLQTVSTSRFKLLFDKTIKQNYLKEDTYPTGDMQHLNVLVELLNVGDLIRFQYNRIDGITYVQTIDISNTIGTYIMKVPISLVKVDGNFVNGCRVDIIFTPNGGSPTTNSFYTYPICEQKYIPVLCDYVNSYGGWQTITLYKAQTNTLSVKNEDYKLSPNEVNYNPLRGQNRSFNFIGTQVLKANTGWVDENYNELITDLLLSEKVLIDKKPVIVKTQGTELKTKLKNRLINYELEFEYSYNLINDVI